MANPTHKKKKRTKKREIEIEKQEGDRAARVEAHRQDAKTEKAIDDGELPPIKGHDDRSDEDEKYFHPEDMLRLLLLQMKVESCGKDKAAAASALSISELQWLSQQQKIGQRHAAASREQATAHGELKRFHAALEQGYGITLSKITFDDTTGLIRQTE